MAGTKLKLKLLIECEAKKVHFTEAGKEIADFLSLPICTIVRILGNKNNVGCLSNLYECLKDLSDTYIQSNQNKISLLYPKIPIYTAELPLLLSDHDMESGKVYVCSTSFCRWYVAEIPNIVCPQGKARMTREGSYLNANNKSVGTSSTAVAEGGFVNGVVTYMVMDNLELKPMFTLSGIALLNKFNVKDVRSL